MVNKRKEFIYVKSNYGGSASDWRVFTWSELAMDAGQYILADSGYWPHSALVPTFKKVSAGPLRDDQKAFNEQASKFHVSVEHAFGMLKGRWQCLKGLRLDPKDLLGALHVEVAIKSTFVLHNLLRRWRQYEDDDPSSSLSPEELIEYKNGLDKSSGGRERDK